MSPLRASTPSISIGVTVIPAKYRVVSSYKESYVMRSEYDSREVAVSRVATPNYIYLSNKLVPGFIAESGNS